MELGSAQESGRTLARGWGFPYLSSGSFPHKVRRLAVTIAAVAALAAAVPATSAGLNGVADAGVLPELPGGTIRFVTTTGFAWRDGIRVGQIVTAITRADADTGWQLDTLGPDGPHISRAAPMDEALKDSLYLGIGAVVLALLGLLFLRTHRRWALPASAVALQLASVPLWIHGNPELSTWSMGAAALAPGLWLANRLPFRPRYRVIAGIAFVEVLFGWGFLRLVGAPGLAGLDAARTALAAVGTVAIVIDQGLGHGSKVSRAASRITLTDTAILALLAGTGLALTYFFAATPFLGAALFAGGVLALPRVRRFVRRRLQDVVLADVRETAKADAVEEERSRLARELHDVLLQQLQAAMRHLEIVDGTAAVVSDLQKVVNEIREVAIDLRPPVLDDLGLPAALEYLADETGTPQVPIILDLEDGIGLDALRRPPEEVEIAVYRIAQEAVLNAIKHGNARRVVISADVRKDSIELRVADDGGGIASGRLKAAASGGRMGIASMRRRAQAIGADLDINGKGEGTMVRLVWLA
jgi:signal transduction histidine kinase